MRRNFFGGRGIRYPNQNSKLSIWSSYYGGGVVGGWVAQILIQTNLKSENWKLSSLGPSREVLQSVVTKVSLVITIWITILLHKIGATIKSLILLKRTPTPSLDKTFRTDNVSTLFGHLAFLRTSIPLAFLDFLIEKLHHRYYNFSLLHRHWQQIYINSSLSRQLSSYYFLY